MKQFLLKNIVLAVVLVLTAVSSIFLIFIIWQKSNMISKAMSENKKDSETVNQVNQTRKPNNVEQSEKWIVEDTDALNKKNNQIYRHFGKPYRPALLKLIKNLSSPAELKSKLPLDPSLVAKPKPKPAPEEGAEEEEAAEKKTEPEAPAAPTDEEKKIFDPAAKVVVISYDEDTLRAALADLYKDFHEASSEDTFVIPDSIQDERRQIFAQLFDKIIEAPEAVAPARAEAYRKAAAEKFAHAFSLFREEVQALTLEKVTDSVAKELFLDSLGLPRLMRQRDCKNYIDFLYESYLASDIIPGLPAKDSTDLNESDRDTIVRSFIYGKNLNPQALPVPEMVIPIIRNFQIKEDLFRRMHDSNIRSLKSLTSGYFYGSTLDSDSESPVLVFTYTIELTSSLSEIDTFINSLHSAYKMDRVYVIKDLKFTTTNEELFAANLLVASHIDETDPAIAARRAQDAGYNQPGVAGAAAQNPNKPAAVVDPNLGVVSTFLDVELTDPKHPDYGRPLLGEKRNDINCTIVVNYLLYRADNITPQ